MLFMFQRDEHLANRHHFRHKPYSQKEREESQDERREMREAERSGGVTGIICTGLNICHVQVHRFARL